jgi:hypothetical protein
VLGSPTTVSATATPDNRPRPSGVPASAEQLRAGAEFGDPASTDASALKLFSLDCTADVITIATTGPVFYAELPCDRSLPAMNVQPFLGKPVRVRAVIANPSKLYMESNTAGTVEFTVGRVWMQPAH